VEIENLSPSLRKNVPDYPLPILRLARLAVDRNAQGKRVGERLMRTVFSIAIELREKLGCVGVVVDAKPGALVGCAIGNGDESRNCFVLNRYAFSIAT
jgi:GNAT superfamily N-acetyltransferase